MPIHDFKCRQCGAIRTELHYENAPVFFCRECSCIAPMKPIISAPGGFDLKGEGFHCNDYPKEKA